MKIILVAVRYALNGRFLQPLSLSCGSLRFVSFSFKAADLTIERNPALKPKPDPSTLVFGKQFSDHMLTVSWSEAGGWQAPQIKPFQNLSLHPASSALHYSIELFEGMKAFRGVDNRIRLFRPMLNMERMYRSTERSCLPLFDKGELIKCINKLVEIDREWVPYSTDASLYIRPTFIGTEPSLGVSRAGHALLFVIIGPVGPYFATGGFSPVSLLADPRYVRAWRGGVGEYKMGGWVFTIISQKNVFTPPDLTIERNPALKPKPDPSTLVFGKQFSDHMLTVSWSEAGGWQAPQIKPFQNLSLHPASSALHYSIEVRECVSHMALTTFLSFIQNKIDFISQVWCFYLNSIRCSATT
uniref:branched-chain-amino-acid transaminase n=1 Tax=Sinocyclocheilus grahami TaxID=75366 RepID=A0A672LK67_SINGR